MTVRIYSVNGRQVFSGKSSDTRMVVPLEFGKGKYVVQVGCAHYTSVEKIMVLQ